MLVRFRQDVIDVHPKVLVVLAGTNDIGGESPDARVTEDIEANYASMAELARAHHIGVVGLRQCCPRTTTRTTLRNLLRCARAIEF